MADQTPPLKDPPENDKTIEDLLNRDAAMMRSPVIWFILLIIPVLFGFYAAYRQPDAPVNERPAVIEYAPPAGTEAKAPQTYEPPPSILGRRGVASFNCPYEDWVGKPADEALQAAMKTENRAFRILPPGSMMTMDHSPERVNFDVDEGNIVTRAWCG